MRLQELVEEVQQDLVEEKKKIAKARIKERLKEISLAKKVLKNLETKLKELLEKDVDDIEDYKEI